MFALAIVALTSFLVSLYATSKFKIYLEKAGILGIDQHKPHKPRLASSGGMPVLAAMLFSLLLAIALDTFLLHYGLNLVLTFAAITSILIAALIGFLDDIYVGKQLITAPTGTKEYRIGLKQWQKPLLIIAAAVPLMVVRAGQTQMALPFFGPIDFWIFYPLVLVPIGVVCVANAYNMLGGFNGLEAGMGIIACAALGLYTWAIGQIEASLIATATAAALAGFLKFNWYPAKILPGDSLTYLTGTAFVCSVILSSAERFGIIIFAPWIAEAFLKLRARFHASNIGILEADGKIKPATEKLYSLTHLAMRANLSEKGIVKLFLVLEAAICALAFALFWPF